MDVRIMSHTSVQILAQIRPDGNLHMIFLPQFRPDGAHTYRGTFGGPDAVDVDIADIVIKGHFQNW